MKIILCSLSSPSLLWWHGCAVTGHRMAASPLHSHWTHAPPEWFWVFCLFRFASFPECGKSTVQKGFNLPVDLKYFPLRRAVCILPSCVYSVLCTIKKFAFSLPRVWNPPLSCPNDLILKQAEAPFSLPLLLPLSCWALPMDMELRIVRELLLENKSAQLLISLVS